MPKHAVKGILGNIVFNDSKLIGIEVKNSRA